MSYGTSVPTKNTQSFSSIRSISKATGCSKATGYSNTLVRDTILHRLEALAQAAGEEVKQVQSLSVKIKRIEEFKLREEALTFATTYEEINNYPGFTLEARVRRLKETYPGVKVSCEQLSDAFNKTGIKKKSVKFLKGDLRWPFVRYEERFV